MVLPVPASADMVISAGCASAEQVQTLIRLTERYCVVYQTLAHPAEITMSAEAGTGRTTTIA